jgi:hypothetical protein
MYREKEITENERDFFRIGEYISSSQDNIDELFEKLCFEKLKEYASYRFEIIRNMQTSYNLYCKICFSKFVEMQFTGGDPSRLKLNQRYWFTTYETDDRFDDSIPIELAKDQLKLKAINRMIEKLFKKELIAMVNENIQNQNFELLSSKSYQQKLINHFYDGGKVEIFRGFKEWVEVKNPKFNFDLNIYRIKA